MMLSSDTLAVGEPVIRGEAVISYKDFEIFNMESDEEYANPRNLASGSLTLKDINEVSRRHIQWIAFTLVYTDEAIDSWGDRIVVYVVEGGRGYQLALHGSARS